MSWMALLMSFDFTVRCNRSSSANKALITSVNTPRESATALAGFGALHVMWQDIAEVRTLAVSEAHRGAGVGHLLIEELLDRARAVGVERVFCLTFEVEFFRRHGFEVMADQSAVDPEVYAELLRSTDEGVAEFLDLARVKPNTLGNKRMIRRL